VAIEDVGSTAAPGTLEQARAQAAVQARSRAVLGQVMFLVAVTVGFTAVGAWVGRDLSGGWSIACFIGGIVAIIGLNWARGASGAAMALLFGGGLLLGLGLGPGLAEYASLDNGPTIIAQAAGATALLVAGVGSWGYATRRDLSSWARTLFWALIALHGVGIVLIFVSIPGAQLAWSILGLILFTAYTAFDFNRLRRAQPDAVVWIAASIFLDILNIFLFMLSILGGGRD
jgi:FtsH-binding integral membrane protein